MAARDGLRSQAAQSDPSGSWGKQIVATDIDRLQGRWSQVAFEENGITDAPDSHGAPMAVLTLSGHSFHVGIPGQDRLVQGSFAIDASRAPKRIEWVDAIGDDAGRIIPAVYHLDGDRFRFAAADPGMPRQKDFTGGPGITIRAFVRLMPMT